MLRVHRHRRPDARARARVRVLARRRRRSSGCETPEEVEVLTAGEHTLRGARGRRGRQRRPDAGDPRPGRSSTCPRPTPRSTSGPDSETDETSATFEFTGEEELTGDAGLRVRVLARQRRLRRLHLAAHGHRPRRRPARVPGPRRGPRRHRRPDPGLLRVADHRPGRHHAARHVHRRRAAARQLRPGRDLRLRQQRAGRGVRVLARRRAVRGLRGRARAPGPGAGRAHARACAPSTWPSRRTSTRRRPAYTWTTLGEPDTTILSGPPDPSGSLQRDLHLRVRPGRRDLPVLGRRHRRSSRAPRRSSPGR